MHLVTLATPDGTVAQRILTALSVAEPPRFLEFTTTAEPTRA